MTLPNLELANVCWLRWEDTKAIIADLEPGGDEESSIPTEIVVYSMPSAN